MPKKPGKSINTIIKVSENGLTVEYPITNTGQVRIKKDGDRSWRNNNTGNLKSMFTSKSNSPIGFNKDFSVFPDMRTGENAQVELL